MPLTRRLLLGSAAATLAVPALAQDFPNRPIRFLLGFPPGGASDAALRIIQPRVQAALGQPMVIDNRPGAAGNLSAEAVARSAPDGHTLVSANIGTLAVNPAMFRSLPFDPVADFAPITLLHNVVNVLVVPADRPWQDLPALLAAARARPEAVTCGSSGVGSLGHLAMIRFEQQAGIRVTHVPYRGGGPLMTGLISGEADFAFATMGTVLPQLEAGKLRAFAVATATRAQHLPELPTLIELGFADFDAQNWDGILAPRATPQPVLDRLGTVLRAILGAPEIQREFLRRGFEARPCTAEAFARQIASDAARWQPVVRAAGVTVG